MEVSEQQQSLLEELMMAPTSYFPNEFIFHNPWNFTPYDPAVNLQNPLTIPPLTDLIPPPESHNYYTYPFGDFQTFLDASPPSPQLADFATMPMIQQDYAANLEFPDGYGIKVEINDRTPPNVDNNEKKSKSEKPDRLPSKNLMAERRRRKRLNDRLSMLRSIVPKISKMDRTSILGDTIDYMKELLQKINQIRDESVDERPDPINLIGSSIKEVTPHDAQPRNPPKFDVERRKEDTRVEVCCTAKPGLLLSTLSTLESLGLDIQHCVISCFNDFSLQASCYEAPEQRSIVSSEDVKQALFRNAGYGGRCL